MDKGFYIGVSGARESMTGMSFHSNNLANAKTVGFKSDFDQYRALNVYGPGHQSRAFVGLERGGTDFSPGPMMTTGRDLDMALDGKGFFADQTVKDGDPVEAYTRAGDFVVSPTGLLTTKEGLPVLGEGGPISIPPEQKVEIGNDGTISVRPFGAPESVVTQIDRIRLVNPDLKQVIKGPDALFHYTGEEQILPDGNVRIRQGVLEGSNVNPVKHLVDMIETTRRYEMNIKMMKNAEENDEASARLLQS